ncbi:class I tRNA ligase family protein, partial [Propionibacterium acidifaciens]|uniref:class I tRNA ligase family protein n=1 Tax=Propionibacterium acidifaciens TaxID=556499 RepID=UPI0023F0A1B5
MRRRALQMTMAAVLVAVVLLGIPLGAATIFYAARSAPDDLERWRTVFSVVTVGTALAIIALAAAYIVAAKVSRRISAPLIYLAAEAEQLGSGQVRPRVRVSGIEEIDLVQAELVRSAERVAGRLAAERQFASDASHQLRTPLTSLSLRLEEIEIIADEHVDMEFGTGLVKVTPAHDQNDYEVGKRHDLEFITVFDEKGILNDKCDKFAGLERLEARDIVVAELEKLGNVEKIEDYENQVGYCYRCKNVVEPYISQQWFVRADIAKEAITKVNSGEAEFFPKHWINSFNAWMRELRDWCISRQLWWGHRIPVFYCDCGHQWADERESPDTCPKCGGKNFTQDPDVLDTWFSSGLWPISTLGWGNGEALKNEKWFEEDLSEFYPNTMLITGFDILFFWVARMMFQCQNAMGELPFHDIYLHALVKDKDGKKMSKSSKNVVDPLLKIDEFSADVLRFTLTILCVQGRDLRLSDDKLLIYRNFTNKLYNASKFLLLNASKFDDLDVAQIKTSLGRYMLSRFNCCVSTVRENLDEYRFNDAATELYKFFWDEFCDWGIELSKADKASVKELGSIFKEAMKLLNPFMPFLS